MRKITLVCFLMLLTFALVHRTAAQDASSGQSSPKAPAAAQAPSFHYYHLDFVVDELDSNGKPVNSRSYTTTVNTDPISHMSIRTGGRIPVATDSGQVTYTNVGVNIDSHHVQEIGRQLALDLTADLTGIAGTDPSLHQPVFRNNQWQADVLIPIGKQSIVFTSDSLDNKGSMRVLVTATLIQ